VHLYKCSCTSAAVQVHLYKCSCTSAAVQVHLYKCSCTSAAVRVQLYSTSPNKTSARAQESLRSASHQGGLKTIPPPLRKVVYDGFLIEIGDD